MQKPYDSAAAVLGVTLGIALVVSGFMVSNTLLKGRAADRYVSVKGLAERTVDADLAVWPLRIKATDNDLGKLYSKLQEQRATVIGFLSEAGFKEDEIRKLPPVVTDTAAETYIENDKRTDRFIGSLVVSLRSNNVPLVIKTMEQSSELVKMGIVLTGNDYSSSTDFLFTSLNDIKPEMIAEATRNARSAAEQFAKDSDSKVGSIRHATQGLFSIENSDRNTPYRKKVRVVTTVDYFIVD